jgi:diguanylate cyclase
MTNPADEHKRTMAIAEIALGQIKALRQPASPRHFEIWYNYATGHNPSLNQIINETVSRNGTLQESDVNEIYESYISANRFTDRIDNVGSQVVGEIEQVMDMIGTAAGKATTYSANLADVTQKLGSATDKPAVREIVQSLVHTTREMEKNNQALEGRLKSTMKEIAQLREHLEAARNESMTDPLTSLSNRKHLDESLAKAITDSQGESAQLTLLMMDIDHFKIFTDSYGHLTGDQVLRLVATTIKQNVKGLDTAARYGGEEFVIVLPNTPLRSAITVAEHIRRAVMNKELVKRSSGESLGRVTISVGVAALHADDTAQALIERADKCLYAAKHGGRNKVVSEVDLQHSVSATPKVA